MCRRWQERPAFVRVFRFEFIPQLGEFFLTDEGSAYRLAAFVQTERGEQFELRHFAFQRFRRLGRILGLSFFLRREERRGKVNRAVRLARV